MVIGLVAVTRALIRGLRALAADPESRGLLSLVTGLIGGGAVFYHLVEELSWLDSFYFTIVTLTTVGYGDISPTTAAGKLFTMAYLLIGIGLLVTFAARLSSQMVEQRQQLTADRQSRRKRSSPNDRA